MRLDLYVVKYNIIIICYYYRMLPTVFRENIVLLSFLEYFCQEFARVGTNVSPDFNLAKYSCSSRKFLAFFIFFNYVYNVAG